MTWVKRYAVAAMLVGASVIVGRGLQSWLGLTVPFLQFFPAVMAAAAFGGLRPGLFAVALSTLLVTWVFIPPVGAFWIADPSDLVSLVLFAVSGVGISWFSHRRLSADDATRTAVEAGLARTQELQAVLDTAVDGIIVIDAAGRVEGFNRGAESLFGYPAAEVLGRNVSILMPAPDRNQHDGYLTRYLHTGEARIIGKGREVSGRRRDGTVFPLHLSVGAMTIGGARKFTGMLHDLSARAETERRLREQTTLARIGEMAAVLAHEVKNPLAGIRGAVQVIGGRLPEESQDRRMVGEIISRIDSLSELMEDLLLFARPPKPEPRLTDLTRLVGATANLLRQDPALREVAVRIEGTAAPLMADAGLMQIVFHNLLVNAAQAMQGRGEIRVSVGDVGASCRVAIADSGPGVPPEHHDKLFTPFFTTKARGSGLGLPTSRRFVEAHRGTIEVACPPAGGTVVTVVLPAEARVG